MEEPARVLLVMGRESSGLTATELVSTINNNDLPSLHQSFTSVSKHSVVIHCVMKSSRISPVFPPISSSFRLVVGFVRLPSHHPWTE